MAADRPSDDFSGIKRVIYLPTRFWRGFRNIEEAALFLSHSEDAHATKQQSESFATVAATARNGGKKPEDIGLEATPQTKGIPTDKKRKADAATKDLREGVLVNDEEAEEEIDALPDRTRDIDAPD
ncbi:MAG: hypothetical protein ACTHP8_22645 [Bosea sp. (in: a-proteobacteria)]|uniref:hypothetical protein n=1 Tax=Bosea sp. (in: a-proteobacteria) TaxID=1871050 RepID=UPI003F7BB6EA